MLSELSIENFAIVDRLFVRFFPGFTVLTGETGAGKSIIIDALQTALGAKVGIDVVRESARFASVEAVFEWAGWAPGGLPEILAEHGIEEDESLILRREINAGGRGTARINGRAVPLAVLSAVGTYLVDIHGQSEHLSILRRDRQLDVLDRYGHTLPLRTEVSEVVHEFGRVRRIRDDLASGQRDAEQRLDLLRFQMQEIDVAGLRPGEEQDLNAEKNLLVNAERLIQLSRTAYDALQGDEGTVLDGMYQAAGAVNDLAGIDPAVMGLAERLQTAQFELEDVAQELRRYRDTIEYDPTRLDTIEERLDTLARLKRKYGPGVEDVMAFAERARADVEDIENFDDRLAALTLEVEATERRAGALAFSLSERRREAAGALERAMGDALQGLGLKSTSFEVQVDRTTGHDGLQVPASSERYLWSSTGIDTISFRVSFNPGESLRPIEKVASGGETSRFMLALKSVLAEADQTPTLVFDEVDVGVGGRAAADVGDRMRELARTHQVISITHLPQIAAVADQHLTVSKRIVEGRTTVQVQSLEVPDRIVEIAEMMTGTGTEAARRNAQELLEAAHRRS